MRFNGQLIGENAWNAGYLSKRNITGFEVESAAYKLRLQASAYRILHAGTAYRVLRCLSHQGSMKRTRSEDWPTHRVSKESGYSRVDM